MSDHLLAEDREQRERKSRAERDFQDYARHKVDDFMTAAGLTPLEHDVYWERAGYLRTWGQIAKLLSPHRAQHDLEGASAAMVGAYRRGHRKLCALAIRRDMWTSPLLREWSSAG